jgi:hypothetical protein
MGSAYVANSFAVRSASSNVRPAGQNYSTVNVGQLTDSMVRSPSLMNDVASAVLSVAQGHSSQVLRDIEVISQCETLFL